MRLRITKNTATPALYTLLTNAKRPRALFEAGAKAWQKEISDHLKRLQARGNAKGWPSQKFFYGKATSVERRVGIASITDKSCEVVIADPRFVHRIRGGTVTPKRKKFLAIPLTAEAYAASGKGSIKESMPGLKVIKFKRGLYLVRETAEKTRNGALGRNKYGPIQRIRVIPLFKLVRSVTHRPHPEELPEYTRLAEVAHHAMFLAAVRLFKTV